MVVLTRMVMAVEGETINIRRILHVTKQSWEKLNAPKSLPLVASGMTFMNGILLRSGVERNEPSS